MKTVIYTKDNCPECVRVKAEMKRDGESFLEVNVGRDITREEFMQRYPQVRSMPYIVFGSE